MSRKPKITFPENMPFQSEDRLDLDKPADPEKKEVKQTWKYICPGCTQIIFHTDNQNQILAEICQSCGRSVSPVNLENFVLCSPEEAEKAREA